MMNAVVEQPKVSSVRNSPPKVSINVSPSNVYMKKGQDQSPELRISSPTGSGLMRKSREERMKKEPVTQPYIPPA